ncbi:MAG: hypothetical protein JST14_17770 [Bacteroidetes bacterium]|nr:hypothetical protein [Bacteroidota bacterium]
MKKKESLLDSLNLKWEDPISGKLTSYSAGSITPVRGNQLKVPGLNPGSTKIPNQNVPGLKYELPGNTSPQLNSINGKGQVPFDANLPNLKMPQADIKKEVAEIETEAGKLKSVGRQIESSKKDINMVRQGKFDSVAQVKQAAEREVRKLDAVKELKKNDVAFTQQKNALEQYKDMMASLNTKEIEDKAKLTAQAELRDQFAGQEARLQAGISELNRLKKKYGQIADSRYLPKRAPNLMKCKPFKERFVPGMNFMIFRNDLFVVDLMPFAMYKLSSRWRGGIGGTYRINFDDHKNQAIGNRDAYGIRAMVDYQFFRGMSAHGEFESINFNPYDPSNLKSLDYVHRQWINGAYLGALKSYRISRQWVGNFQVLYNFLYERNGLYNSKVNIRFGFEFDSNGKKPKFVPAGK